MDKAQTRKRQSRITHIIPDLRKAHSDIARGLSLNNKTKEQYKITNIAGCQKAIF